MYHTINYIIATYARKYEQKFQLPWSASLSLENYLLYNLSVINKLKNNLTQITIMKPKINNDHLEIKDYYNFDKIDIANIKNKIKILECENIGLSYGQFFNTVKNNNDFDYYIFVEDD